MTLPTPAERRTIVLTFAAATATVISVAAILVAPTLDACRGRDDGPLACIRDGLAGAGLLPAVDPPVTATQEPVSPVLDADQPVDQVAEGQAGPALPQLVELRVDPDGSIVVAGRGVPGEGVSVYANGELVGTVTASPDGTWSVLPDQPLPPGGTAITAGDADGGAVAEEAFVVVVDPERADEPQVILSTPEETAGLLLDIAPPLTELPEGGDVPAEADPVPEGDADEAVEPDPGMTADPPASAPPQPTDEPSPEHEPVDGEPVADEPGASELSTPAAPPEEAPDPDPSVATPVTEDSNAADRARREVARALETPHDVPSPTPSRVPPVPDPAVIERGRREAAEAIADPLDVSSPAPARDAPVVERAPDPMAIDRGRREAAMAVREAERVMREVERAVREATSAGAAQPEPLAEQAPAEQVAGPPVSSAADRARREVARAIEAARTAAAIAVDASPTEFKQGLPPYAVPAGLSPRARAETAATVRAPGVPQAEADTEPPRLEAVPGKSELAAGVREPAAEPEPEPVQPEPGPESVAEPARPVPPPVEVSVRLSAPEPVRPEPPPPPAEPPPPPPAEPPPAPAEPPARTPGPKVLAVPLAMAEYERRVPGGEIVVRSGDTLWDIARRVYGDGYKYRTIFRANRHILSRPGSLRPGQVLVIPLVFD